jgi:hypothetical protein
LLFSSVSFFFFTFLILEFHCDSNL